jgi:trimethylamine--corrinoid protein Co-methyltransferase
MAGHFGLPAFSPANYTDARSSDVQCGSEKTLSAVAGMASGSHIGMFGGDLHDAMTISYEQLLLDYDIWEGTSRFVRGVRVDRETLAREVIERLGHGGDILTDPHTMDWMRRDEHYFGQFSARDAGENGMLQRAHERVGEVLQAKQALPVPASALERIDAYVRDETVRIRITRNS